MVGISCISANEGFNLPNLFVRRPPTLFVVAPLGAIDTNLAHAVAIPHPSRPARFVDSLSSKFMPFEPDAHVGGSAIACGGHAMAAPSFADIGAHRQH